MNISDLAFDFGMMLGAFAALFVGLRFTMKLRAKTKKVTPLWLFIEVGVMLLMLYALSGLLTSAAFLLLGEGAASDWIGDNMDLLQTALITAAACFLTAAGLLLKNSPVKPI